MSCNGKVKKTLIYLLGMGELAIEDQGGVINAASCSTYFELMGVFSR